MTTRTSIRRALDLDDEVGRLGRAACAVAALLLAALMLPLTPLYPDPTWARVLASVALVLVAYPLGLAVVRAVRHTR